MAKNTVCNITLAQFVASAKSLVVTIDGRPTVADVKQFSTGSFGWYCNGKVNHTFKTKADFKANAKPIIVTIDGIPHAAEPKDFSTGSVGFYLNGKVNIKVGDITTPVQIGLSLTVVKSKEVTDVNAPLDGQMQVGMNLTVVGSKDLATVAA